MPRLQNMLQLFAKLRAIATCYWWISSPHYAAKQLPVTGCCFQEKAINSLPRPSLINLVFHPSFLQTPSLCARPSCKRMPCGGNSGSPPTGPSSMATANPPPAVGAILGAVHVGFLKKSNRSPPSLNSWIKLSTQRLPFLIKLWVGEPFNSGQGSLEKYFIGEDDVLHGPQ
jgi:hypothetical protein